MKKIINNTCARICPAVKDLREENELLNTECDHLAYESLEAEKLAINTLVSIADLREELEYLSFELLKSERLLERMSLRNAELADQRDEYAHVVSNVRKAAFRLADPSCDSNICGGP